MTCDSLLNFVGQELNKEIKILNDRLGYEAFIKDDDLLIHQEIKLLVNLVRINARIDKETDDD